MTALDSGSAGTRRIARGVAANALSFTTSTGMQIVTVPVLIHFWGLSLYGVWVILSTIPSYLALSNVGVAMAAGNELAALLTVGDRARARVVYGTAATIIGTLSLAALVGGTTIAALMPAHIMPVHPQVSPNGMRGVIIALVLYGVAVVVSELPMAKYRATGRYARGTSIMTAVLFVERAAVLGAAAFGFVPAAVLFTAVRLCGTAWMLIDASRAHLDLRPRLRDASWTEAKRLALLGSGMILYTVAMAVNLQGPVVVLGAALAPAAVGLFSATRTLTRLGIQATGIITASVNAEFSIVWGSPATARRRRLFALTFVVSATIMATFLIALLLFGQDVARLWLVGTAQPSFALIALLAIGSALQGCWLAIGSLILAANRQFAFTPAALFIAVATLAPATFVVPRWGVEGMAALLCAAEAVTVLWVYRQAARVGVGSVFEAPRDAAAMAREWLQRRRRAA
ncbi:MAG: hypothetical protein ABW194_01685 [Novosphingobium sp.]